MPDQDRLTSAAASDAVELMLRRALRRALSGFVVTGATLATGACDPEPPLPNPTEPVRCPSGTWYPVRASGLKPEASYDYVAIRQRMDYGVGIPEEEPGWHVPLGPSVDVLSETGEACASASNAQCAELVAHHEAPFIRTSCEQTCYERSVVTTQGDEVKRWTGLAELRTLLGTIDSLDDALLLVSAADYDIACNNAASTSVARVDDGYVVYATRMTASCAPIIITRYKIHVSSEGELTVLSSEELSRDENTCVGRKPAGLNSRAAKTDQSKLGDTLASAAHLEAASVFSFTRLLRELEAHGAPQELVEQTRRARADEVRHAKVVGGLARARGGKLVPIEPGSLHVRSLLEAAIENAVEGCVRETYGALVGAYQAEAAGDDEVRAAMLGIAEDEARHAALSHAVHQWAIKRLSTREREAVRRAQTRAIFDLARENAVAEPDFALSAALGLPSPELSRRLLRELVQSLWRPILDDAPAQLAPRDASRRVG